jgi:curved DNA-binding protein CbpA
MRRKPKFDPYAALGVAKKADKAAVKRAYRTRAKKAHPDAGGAAEDFAEIQRAYLLLSDDTRRARYDADGNTDDPKPDDKLQGALGIIGGMLAAALEGDVEPTSLNLVKEMTKYLNEQESGAKQKLKKPRKALVRAEKLHGRFKKKNGENHIEGILRSHARSIREVVARIEREIEVLELARRLLTEYEFTADMQPQMMPTFSMLYTTGATS